MPSEKSFWESVPGILTGVAAIITAVAGVIAIYYHSGSQPSPSASPAEHASASRVSNPPPEKLPAKIVTGEVSFCSRTFSEAGETAGTRVLYFEANDSIVGGEVYLDGKCQGYLGNRSSGRLADNMLVNVPPGSYEIALKKKGYQEFRSRINVPSSNTPLNMAPKVILQVRLFPSTP